LARDGRRDVLEPLRSHTTNPARAGDAMPGRRREAFCSLFRSVLFFSRVGSFRLGAAGWAGISDGKRRSEPQANGRRASFLFSFKRRSSCSASLRMLRNRSSLKNPR
jgi:hypothetical protein